MFLQLIFAGKILKDNALPLSSFIPADASPVAIHIVIKAPAVSAAATNVPSTSAAPFRASTSVSASENPPGQSAQPIGPVPSQRRAPPASDRRQREQSQPAVSSGDRPRNVFTDNASGSQPPPRVVQPQFASMFGMPPTATTMPTAAAAVAAGVYGTQAAIYGPAYLAAYEAALQSLMSQQAQQDSGATSSHGQQPAMNFLPSMFPQPVLPPGFLAPQQQQQEHQGGEIPAGAAAAGVPPPPGQMGPPMFQFPMQFAYPMAVPMHQVQQMHQIPMPQMAQRDQGHHGGDLRRRRRLNNNANNNNLPDEVMRLARQLRARGVPMPAEINAALDRQDVAAGRAPGGQQGAGRGRVRGIQLRVRINVRALLQIAVLLVVVYQHCPPRRFILLCVLGFVLWLSTLPRIRDFLQAITGMGGAHHQQNAAAQHPEQPAAEQDGAAQAGGIAGPDGINNNDNNAPAERRGEAPAAPEMGDVVPNAPGQPQAQAAPAPPQRRGLLHEIHAFVVGFITSLLPAMDQQNNPAAADGGQRQDIFGGGD